MLAAGLFSNILDIKLPQPVRCPNLGCSEIKRAGTIQSPHSAVNGEREMRIGPQRQTKVAPNVPQARNRPAQSDRKRPTGDELGIIGKPTAPFQGSFVSMARVAAPAPWLNVLARPPAAASAQGHPALAGEGSRENAVEQGVFFAQQRTRRRRHWPTTHEPLDQACAVLRRSLTVSTDFTWSPSASVRSAAQAGLRSSGCVSHVQLPGRRKRHK